MVRAALQKLYEIRAMKNDRRIQAKQAGGNAKETIRRGTLMKMLQTSASLLPVWMGKLNEKPPPLCGAVPADINYVAKVKQGMVHTWTHSLISMSACIVMRPVLCTVVV